MYSSFSKSINCITDFLTSMNNNCLCKATSVCHKNWKINQYARLPPTKKRINTAIDSEFDYPVVVWLRTSQDRRWKHGCGLKISFTWLISGSRCAAFQNFVTEATGLFWKVMFSGKSGFQIGRIFYYNNWIF